MSNFDDEMAALEAELSKQEKPKDKTGTLFPSLLANSKRELGNLKNIANGKNGKEVPLPEIPDTDDRVALRNAEESLNPSSNEEYERRLEECGYCGMCPQCKVFIYNSYKLELARNGVTDLSQYEARIEMHQRAAVAAQERERAVRDLWEEALKSASDEEKALRQSADRQYVPLTSEIKKRARVSKAAQDIANGKKPTKRISRDEKMAAALQAKGIDFAALMQGMANFASAVKQGKFNPDGTPKKEE